MASLSTHLGSRLLLLVQQAPCRCTSASVSSSSQTTLSRVVRLPPSTRRLFQTTPPRRAAVSKPAAPLPKSKTKTATPKPKPAASSPAGGLPRAPPSYADQLAAKGRTLLYEAPSHLWFRVASFTSGAFCVSYTVYQYWSVYLHPPEGLYSWVPHAFGIICLFMGSMGAYFVLGTRRIVRTIEAVPAALARTHPKGYLPGSRHPPIPLYIEVASSRVLPFLPPRRQLYLPEDVLMPFRMQGVLSGQTNAGQLAQSAGLKAQIAQRAEKQARIKARQEELANHRMTVPFRDMGKALKVIYQGVTRAFNRDGFAKMKLKGQEYKIDVSSGWALDDGRAMDRLLLLRPNAMRS
ncbi:hypothetical protein B0T22DRAFT_17532 [Podospora appendiculata]|uniref:Uncharacterized protein n=1 Tax=Podospora appendiculata TaxID=314037 RepID=A0AAE0XFZ3_9PEZI|nr:hypothetical protein B0T22DRAFT_17532 [Podospora appendiculata]